MSTLFVVGAPSGTGKTTLLRWLLERVPRLRFSVSHTTRRSRPGELRGRDYHFVERAEFEAAVQAGEFLEWAAVYGNLYGTHRSQLDRARADGVDLILDIDVQGAGRVRAAVPGAVLILILPPSWEELERRLRSRGTESEESIARRLAEARAQVERHELYDLAIVNDDAERAYRDLEASVLRERLRTVEQMGHIRKLLASSP